MFLVLLGIFLVPLGAAFNWIRWTLSRHLLASRAY